MRRCRKTPVMLQNALRGFVADLEPTTLAKIIDNLTDEPAGDE